MMKNKTNARSPGRQENKVVIGVFAFPGVPASWRSCILFVVVSLMSIAFAHAAPIPDDFPKFIVPGHEKEMDSLRALFWLHYKPAVPLIPLWDAWMPMSTLWPARNDLEAMRGKWAAALSSRPMSEEGYVFTLQ